MSLVLIPSLSAGDSELRLPGAWRLPADRPAVVVAAPAGARAHDDFIAVLAHELRNPLQAIRAASGLLARLSLDRPASDRKALSIIERQSLQLSRLVDDLLDASRVAHGKISLHVEPLRLSDVLDTAIDANRAQAEARGVYFLVKAPAHEILLMADPVRLAQVFGNLLHNATKFGGTGRVIEIGVSENLDGSLIDVSVRDEGIGMTPAVLESIFGLFVQEDRAVSLAHDGLGIGLSLVRSLVELHGGKVSAHSGGIGRGSAFTVVLPRGSGPRQLVHPTRRHGLALDTGTRTPMREW
jgi:signal transduction histidine kinase